MFRLFIWVMLLLTGLFAATIGLIRAQPYDDAELRGFLLPPEGCSAPCWQGIRPGVTTVDEAVQILSAFDWFTNVRLANFETILVAEWSDQHPSFVSPRSRGAVTITFDDNRVVTRLQVGMDTPAHWFRLLLGAPDREEYLVIRNYYAEINRSLNNPQYDFYHIVTYDEQQFTMMTSPLCPLTIRRLWTARAWLILDAHNSRPTVEYEYSEPMSYERLSDALHDPYC